MGSDPIQAVQEAERRARIVNHRKSRSVRINAAAVVLPRKDR
jgi:hypothetical protein